MTTPANGETLVLVPLEPELMDSQLAPAVTEADQAIVPVPVFETLNEVVFAAAPTG